MFDPDSIDKAIREFDAACEQYNKRMAEMKKGIENAFDNFQKKSEENQPEG